MPEITSEAIGLEKVGGATRVTVEVVAIDMGIVNIKFGAQLRARARALLAAGTVNTAADTTADVLAGDIQRFTEVVSTSERDAGRGRQKIVYEIDVNSD